MSASNGGISSERFVTVFTITSSQFPHKDNEKINTVEFLEASKAVVAIIEKFGKVFAPVKYDMNGNITKLTKKFNEDVTKHKYLEDMVLFEKAEGGIVAIDALQWLRRGLHFIVRFFQCIIENRESKEENLEPYVKIAYSETLQPYHGWMATQMFKVVSRLTPNRRELFYNLALESHDKEEHVLRDMHHFTTQLSGCIFKLIQFYNEHRLESTAKV